MGTLKAVPASPRVVLKSFQSALYLSLTLIFFRKRAKFDSRHGSVGCEVRYMRGMPVKVGLIRAYPASRYPLSSRFHQGYVNTVFFYRLFQNSDGILELGFTQNPFAWQ